MTSPTLEPHPFSKLFPPSSEEDFGKLAADIKLHGLHQPIVRYQGQILDGNNRYRACELVKIAPKFADFNGDDAAARNYVISANIHRRHLSPDQRRDIIATLLRADPTQSNRQLAEQTKTSHHTVGDVRTELETTGQIAQLETTTGADGKKRRTRNTSTSNPSDRYDKAEENLIKKLQALLVEQAEGAAKETIKLLNSTVATMKVGAKSAKAA
jgi:ParB-like chromosome segregation protein Spo0J